MGKNTKSFEIKLEYLIEDGDKFWKCLDEINELIGRRQDVPAKTAINLLSILSKANKSKVLSEKERISKIYYEALNGIEEQKIELNGHIFRTYYFPVDHEERIKEEYSIGRLVSSVISKYERSKKDSDIRPSICRYVIEYLNDFNISTKKLSDYKRAFISCKIIEALGSSVLDKKAPKRNVSAYYNAIQHHYKKAKDRLKK
ncbi:MAG: hypothetical protein IPM74_11145 [Crocinitomicaceae bacterium]|nr:hypothetical protein [Crocinitomicaceae bacterium]MBK8926438.1 hypothetical protein [Crocinitomicaceae bacterium]